MKVAVMQSYLFPALSYFQLVGEVERCVLRGDVNYLSRVFSNHNRVLGQGIVRRFSVPVPEASINRLISVLAFSSKRWASLRGFARPIPGPQPITWSEEHPW